MYTRNIKEQNLKGNDMGEGNGISVRIQGDVLKKAHHFFYHMIERTHKPDIANRRRRRA